MAEKQTRRAFNIDENWNVKRKLWKFFGEWLSTELTKLFSKNIGKYKFIQIFQNLTQSEIFFIFTPPTTQQKPQNP
jgi:hypothetical protein